MHHENTRLYQTALDLVALCASVVEHLPPGLGFLGDQLRRASSSVPLNFCEGCLKSSRKERTRYFETAAGSAREVSAILDVAVRFKGISEEARLAGKDHCDHICAMLYKFR